MRIAVTASPVTPYAGQTPGSGDVAFVGRDGARAILGAFLPGATPLVVGAESWFPEPIPANYLVGVDTVLLDCGDGEGAETVAIPTIVAVFGPAR